MVICGKYNFIFLRIPKNASTSLAAFFVNNFCDNNDIYTYIGNAHVSTHNVDPDIVSKFKQDHRIIHLTLNEIVDNGIITHERANNSTVIGVIRNPLERQLSLFFFLSKEFKLNDTSVEAFRRQFRNGCHETDPSNCITQYDYLKLGDKNVGWYWPYDRINDMLDSFVKTHGIQVKEPLKNYKGGYREGEYDELIAKYYDLTTRKAVEDYYADDVRIYQELLDGNR